MAFHETDMNRGQPEQGGGCSPGADTRRIQRDIDSTRQAMDQTIARLAERLTPRSLLNEAVDSLRGGSSRRGNGSSGPGSQSGMGKILLDQARLHPLPTALMASAAMAPGLLAVWVKRHPVPAALITGGLMWLFREGRGDEQSSASATLYGRPYGPRSPSGSRGIPGEVAYGDMSGESSGIWDSATEKMHRAANRTSEMASQAARRAREAANQAAEQARRMTGQVGQQVRDAAASAQHQIRRGYEQTSETVSQTVQQYPLAACAAGIAAGMLVGFAVPRTRREDEMYGQQADQLKETVKDRAREMSQEAKQAAREAVQTAKDQAREQGLTAGAVRDKVSQIAQNTMQATKENVKQKMGSGQPQTQSSSNPSREGPPEGSEFGRE